MKPFKSTQGLPEAAQQLAESLRPVLVALVAGGYGHSAAARYLTDLRIAAPGGGIWTKMAVKRVLIRLELEDVRKATRVARGQLVDELTQELQAA